MSGVVVAIHRAIMGLDEAQAIADYGVSARAKAAIGPDADATRKAMYLAGYLDAHADVIDVFNEAVDTAASEAGAPTRFRFTRVSLDVPGKGDVVDTDDASDAIADVLGALFAKYGPLVEKVIADAKAAAVGAAGHTCPPASSESGGTTAGGAS